MSYVFSFVLRVLLQLIPVAPDSDEPDSMVNHLLWAQGLRWKRLRTAANPAFSTGKLKSYQPLVDESQSHFSMLLAEKAKSGETFDIRRAFQLLTIDVIAKVGFGLDFNAIQTKGKGNPFLLHFQELLDVAGGSDPLSSIIRVFPVFKPLGKAILNYSLKNMSAGPFKPIHELLKLVEKVLRDRVGDASKRRNDLLQLLIDNSELAEGATSDGEKWLLTETDIKAMEFLFFFAGYETTSSMLAYAAYCLATTPDVQDKLVDEIYSKYPKGAQDVKPDYETVMNNMPYLDWVVRETLRRYPIAFSVVNRFVVEETDLCGIPIDKGCVSVLVDIWSIHQNSEIWGPVDPKRFYPERFAPEYAANRPESAYLPFGIGPRQCIGMRLALFEMKLTLVNMLHRFKIIEPEGGYPAGGLKVVTRESGILIPANGVPLRLVERK